MKATGLLQVNLDQWTFYGVPARAIDETGQKSIGLAAVERLGPKATFLTLPEVVARVREGAGLAQLPAEPAT